MGLTRTSTGASAVDCFSLEAQADDGHRIALAGNPNVGKSTVFNGLTGLHQHTGNWPGKTVTGAMGNCTYEGETYTFIDLPGCYSLMAHSAEEEVARDFICFGKPEAVVVVCDAVCLERNLNLVLQTIEITGSTVVCVNLVDEAKKKKIELNFDKLQTLLEVPIVSAAARTGEGLSALIKTVKNAVAGEKKDVVPVRYAPFVETAIEMVIETLPNDIDFFASRRWIALKLLERNPQTIKAMKQYICNDIDTITCEGVDKAWTFLNENGITRDEFCDIIVRAIVGRAEKIANQVAVFNNQKYDARDRKIDKILAGKWGFCVMFLMLLFIFWITIVGSNVPSQFLSKILFQTEEWLYDGLIYMRVPKIICEALVHGVCRMVIWVVSVMLPPMAIFFPLFTLLEDLGYLPRVAFNLDRCFKKCNACGKQALTMWKGFLLCARTDVFVHRIFLG